MKEGRRGPRRYLGRVPCLSEAFTSSSLVCSENSREAYVQNRLGVGVGDEA